MNNLTKNTITTLEVADMMETEHSKIIRKLEGSKDRKGFIQILNEAQMGVVDYFIKSSYVDAKGEERPCYEVTKLGCDFLANKSTGEKGVLFTARYVKKFYEMEHGAQQAFYIDSSTLKGVSSTGNLIRNSMKDQGSSPYEVTMVLDSLFKQSGICLPDCFVKKPEYEQIDLFQ
ncbi:Rha family transcriptional regulator [Robinsoniella peoriensis]|uniref:Rha family transcriptional regulator n=1 Tax=Robinsoniella peoriensis TaxID=180332 RepID=UPI00363862B4